ncbi:hypothetical protein MKX01_015959 [Papaver californicum]|nr:hypothetical protein MKX01_015959 [Papaver californicum]
MENQSNFKPATAFSLSRTSGDNQSTQPEVKNYWSSFLQAVGENGTMSQDSSPLPNVQFLSINRTNNANNNLEDPKPSEITTDTGNTWYESVARFEDLGLSEELLKGLYVEMRFNKPSKIQSMTLPMILKPPYKDLVAQSHNGTGKTTCFVLGMLSRVNVNLKAPQALCICPTRELAIQNLEVLTKMGKYTDIKSYCAIPMGSKSPDLPISKRMPLTQQVVIGTPGTIKKWISYKKLSLREIKILVFDEADHMLAEDGFRDDSTRIMRDIKASSAHCQVLLFSASFNDIVRNFISRVITEGNKLFVEREQLSLDVVKQYKVNCPDELAKIRIIKDKIFDLGEHLGQTVIFVHSRASASALHAELEDSGWECSIIHGAVDNDERDKIVKGFKEGLTKVLISTDLLARGFDQSQVNVVVNYDLPVIHDSPSEPDFEVYLHRCGRAGRFGRKGAVFNLLCTEKEFMLMHKIERHYGNCMAEIRNWNDNDEFCAALQAARLL